MLRSNLDRLIPKTWRELEIYLAYSLGWKICKHNVTASDHQWHICKAIRGPKWYAARAESLQGIWLRSTKEEAEADLPEYAINLEDNKDLWRIDHSLLRNFSTTTSEPRQFMHYVCIVVAILFNIDTSQLPPADSDDRKPTPKLHQ